MDSLHKPEHNRYITSVVFYDAFNIYEYMRQIHKSNRYKLSEIRK